MSKLLLLSVLSIGIFFALFNNGYSASNEPDLDRNQIYELRERCSEATNNFLQQWSSLKTSYENHYNRKLNQCFALITTRIEQSTYENMCSGSKGDGIVKRLYAVYENKQYGILIMENLTGKLCTCDMLDELCNSAADWYSFANPYMKE